MAAVLLVIFLSTLSGSMVSEPSFFMSAKIGIPPHQRTACGVAEKVKEGTITSLPSMSAAFIIASNAAWPLQKFSVGTSRYLDNWASNSTTQGELLVTCPERRAALKRSKIISSWGKRGLTMFNGVLKMGGPPKIATLFRGDTSNSYRFLSTVVVNFADCT